MLGDREGEQPQQHEERDEEDSGLGFKVFDRRFWADEDNTEETGESRAEAPSYVADLEQKVQQKDKQLREYIAAYKQEVVENLEQTKARLERDAEQRIQTLRGEFATPMLEVFDALERSLTAAQANTDAATLRQGLEMVTKLMVQKLGSLGLERIPTTGEAFDPHLHEAVAVAEVDDPAQNNRIVAEFSPGFVSAGRVVRPAKVQVGKTKQ